jgi:mannose-6-phosphate isomerase class I
VRDVVDLDGVARAAETDPDSLQIVVLTRGEATLRWAGGEERLMRGGAVVLPAVLGRYQIAGEGEALRCAVTPPPTPTEALGRPPRGDVRTA